MGVSGFFGRAPRRDMFGGRFLSFTVTNTVVDPPNARTSTSDKGVEMELIPVEHYVKAVEALMARNAEHFPPGGEVSIFLTTEDPVAQDEFQKAARARAWRVFVYSAAVLPDADAAGKPQQDAARRRGASGRHSMISLLLAMESNFFVLTIGSNWSRLMDEIRTGILERACGESAACTDSIALHLGGPKKQKQKRGARPILLRNDTRRLMSSSSHPSAHMPECHCTFIRYTAAPLGS
jgi:hypothetical protein